MPRPQLSLGLAALAYLPAEGQLSWAVPCRCPWMTTKKVGSRALSHAAMSRNTVLFLASSYMAPNHADSGVRNKNGSKPRTFHPVSSILESTLQSGLRYFKFDYWSMTTPVQGFILLMAGIRK